MSPEKIAAYVTRRADQTVIARETRHERETEVRKAATRCQATNTQPVVVSKRDNRRQ